MWRSTYEVTHQVVDDLGEKNASLISAGVAFYGLFAVFPGIAATFSLFGLLADPPVVEYQLDLMPGPMPGGGCSLPAKASQRVMAAVVSAQKMKSRVGRSSMGRDRLIGVA